MRFSVEAVEVDRSCRQQTGSKAEIALLVCWVASLLVSCVLWSARKQAWMDEIFTWKEVTDPSLWHLLSAIQHGADGGQPLFYITAWLWAKAFGASDLSLRLYSSLGVCGAVVVSWKCVRRFYGVWITAIGLMTVWGASYILLDQNAEARFYGLFMLTVSLAVLLYLRLVEDATPAWRLLILNLLVQAAVVLTHVLGIVYGALILASLVAIDRIKGRFRWKVYLTHAAGWLALLVWIPAMRASMAAGKPHGWIPLPTLYNLYDAYTYWAFLSWLGVLQGHAAGFVFQLFRRGSILIFLIPVFAVLLLVLRGCFRVSRFPFVETRALLIVGLALLCAPVALFVLSHLVTPVLMPRYVLPSAIGTAIVLASLADYLRRLIPLPLIPATRWVAIGGVVLMMTAPIASALIRGPWSSSSRFLDVATLEKQVPSGVPLVMGWQPDFAKLMRYSQKPEAPYYYLLDWPSALGGPRPFVLEYHLMQSYRNAGYFSQNIEDSQSFLCAHADFLVLDSHDQDPREAGTSWFDFSIRNDPRFQWHILRSLDGPGVTRYLIAVHRKEPVACNQP